MKNDTEKSPSKITSTGAAIEIDLDKVQIDEDFDDGLTGSKVITKNQVFNSKPAKEEWFRVMGDSLADIKKGVSVSMMASDNKIHSYYVYGSNEFVSRVKEDFKGCKKFRHAMYKTSTGRYGIWPVSIPKNTFINKWTLTAMDTIEAAQHSWVRTIANEASKHYDSWVADDQDEFPELKWELTPNQMISYAWDNFILTEDNYENHPDVIRALRGKPMMSQRLKDAE